MNDDMMGHNLPPSDITVLRETLEIKNEALIDRQKELMAGLDRCPAECDDEETSKKMTDMVKMMANCKKSLDGQRVAEKEPYLTLERGVDSFFKPLIEGLDNGKRKLEGILGKYLKKKADEERRAREEAARLAREAAAKLAEEAAAAERAAAAARAEADQADAAQLPSLAQSNEAEATALDKTVAAKLDDAVNADREADKMKASSEQKASKMAHVHGDYGSRSSLRTKKIATIVSRETIDLEALRPHFTGDHLQVALNSYMKANWVDDKNPPVLVGANFDTETLAQVR